MTEILYKYRSLDNFKNFVDIILNNRLYAAKYDDLNDPMEGHYLYKNGFLDQDLKEKIYNNKQELRLCSLSKTHSNFLMWSHYSDGHKGVAIGVRIDDRRYTAKQIEYLENLRYFDNSDGLDALSILCCKINLWEYENEVRVFSTGGTTFIDVIVEEIHLGSKMSNQDVSFIRSLVEKINPNIQVIRQ